MEGAWNNYQVYVNDEINFIDEDTILTMPSIEGSRRKPDASLTEKQKVEGNTDSPSGNKYMIKSMRRMPQMGANHEQGFGSGRREPRGMMAALAAAGKGHRVTLFEKK